MPTGAVDVDVSVLLVAVFPERGKLGVLIMEEVEIALELLFVERPKDAEYMLDSVVYNRLLDDPSADPVRLVVVKTVSVTIVVRVGQVFVLASTSDAATASPAAIGTKVNDHI